MLHTRWWHDRNIGAEREMHLEQDKNESQLQCLPKNGNRTTMRKLWDAARNHNFCRFLPIFRFSGFRKRRCVECGFQVQAFQVSENVESGFQSSENVDASNVIYDQKTPNPAGNPSRIFRRGVFFPIKYKLRANTRKTRLVTQSFYNFNRLKPNGNTQLMGCQQANYVDVHLPDKKSKPLKS